MTFGIPVETFPVTYDGELKTTNHAKWLARRQSKDYKLQERGIFTGIDLPGKFDVLLGRGSLFQSHHGNIMLRQLVKLRHADYQAAKVGEKAAISSTIVQAIHHASGRFLERNQDDWWEEISEKEARKKVSKSFRTLAAQTAKKPPQFSAATAHRRNQQAHPPKQGEAGRQGQPQQPAREEDGQISDATTPYSDGEESYCCLATTTTTLSASAKKTQQNQFRRL